jgi:hypothetical protein
LRFNLSISIFCAARLLTASLPLTFATTKQLSISQSAPLKYRTSSILECRLLSIKTWSIWLCVFPSGDVQVYLWILWWGNSVLWQPSF